MSADVPARTIDSRRLLELLLLGICLLLVLYRFFHLDGKMTHRKAWGEAQYAMVAAGYVEHGPFLGAEMGDVFLPLVNYVPVSPLLTALVVHLADTELIYTGRAISFLASLAAFLAFYRLARFLFPDRLFAAAALFIFTVVPVNMFYSRLFHNDPIHLLLIIVLTHLFLRRVSGERIPYYAARFAVLFFLILITKPTTLLIIGLPVVVHLWLSWRQSTLSLREIAAFVVPPVMVGGFLVVNRLLYTEAGIAETGKIFDSAVWNELGRYTRAGLVELLKLFNGYVIPFVLGSLIALRGHRVFRYLVFMGAGFLVFYALFLQGALSHQYYTLPFVVPLSLLAAFAFQTLVGRVTSRSAVQVVLLAVLLTVPLRFGQSIAAAYAPEYHPDVHFVSDMLQREPTLRNTFVMAKAHRIFQYYLGIPTSLMHWKFDFRTVGDPGAFLDENEIDALIIETRLRGEGFPDLEALGFELSYQSDRYQVFKRRGD